MAAWRDDCALGWLAVDWGLQRCQEECGPYVDGVDPQTLLRGGCNERSESRYDAHWGKGRVEVPSLDLEVPSSTDPCFELGDFPVLVNFDLESKWGRAIAKLGVDSTLLSGDMGHA